MSDPRFELLLHNIEADTDAYDLANKLSKLLGSDARSLEKQLVKVKYSNGRSEALKVGLTKDKAEHFQKIFTNLGLKTSIQAELALVPMEEKEPVKESFVCPACHAKQEINEGKIKICSECGIVKDKYDEVQKRKRLAAEHLKQVKAMERQAKVRPSKSIEEKNEEYLRKKLNTHKKKSNTTMLVSVFLGVVAIGAGSYTYFNGKNTADEIDNLQGEKVVTGSSGSLYSDQGIDVGSLQNAKMSQSSLGASDTSEDDFLEGLGNPYSQLVDPSAPKISMQEGIKRINSLLKKNNKKLPEGDKAALANISTLYKESEEAQEEVPDYNLVKNIASSIDDENVRDEVVRQASWGEVKHGVKGFNEFGIYPSVREGEGARSVELATKLMKLYIRDHKFDKAAEMISQIEDLYLKAVAYNKIIDTQFYFDLEGAKLQRDKIKVISDVESLTMVQKALVLGVLSRVEGLIKDKEAAEAILKKVQLGVNDITNTKVRASTLIQLSEDQREGLNLRYAHLFLEQAHTLVKKEKMDAAEQDRVYGVLAKQYAKLFEFKRAKVLMAKISNSEEKVVLAQAVASIEKQSSL